MVPRGKPEPEGPQGGVPELHRGNPLDEFFPTGSGGKVLSGSGGLGHGVVRARAECHLGDDGGSCFSLDGQQGIVEQDKSIAGFVLQTGRSIVVVVNKWDGLLPEAKRQIQRDLARHFLFLPPHETIQVSALRGMGIEEVLSAARRAHQSALKRLPTNQLNRLLAEAVERQPPARQHGRSIKLKYAHQGGRNPPTVVIHGTMVDRLTPGYRRYLAGFFARAFKLIGSPIQIETRTSKNRYGRRR